MADNVFVIVDEATAITREQAASGYGVQITPRIDPVTSRHGRSRTRIADNRFDLLPGVFPSLTRPPRGRAMTGATRTMITATAQSGRPASELAAALKRASAAIRAPCAVARLDRGSGPAVRRPGVPRTLRRVCTVTGYGSKSIVLTQISRNNDGHTCHP